MTCTALFQKTGETTPKPCKRKATRHIKGYPKDQANYCDQCLSHLIHAGHTFYLNTEPV